MFLGFSSLSHVDEYPLLPLATGEVAPGALLLLQFLLLGVRIPVEGGRGAEELGLVVV